MSTVTISEDLFSPVSLSIQTGAKKIGTVKILYGNLHSIFWVRKNNLSILYPGKLSLNSELA